MDIQSMFKIDNYTKLLKYQQQIKELREIENVRKIYIEFDFQYRERWIAQALSMYNKNTHKYFGNIETDVYSDGGMAITGLDAMISNIEQFITDCKKYVPGGPIQV